MDTTAHRILKQARDLLVDGLDLYRLDVFPSEPARHGMNDEQQAAVVEATRILWHLIDKDPSPPDCQNCATALVQPKTGRPRRYCSPACRQADYRARNGYELADDELLAQADDDDRTWAGLSQHARLLIMNAGLTVAAYVDHHFPEGVWLGDECGCTDDRCIGFHHLEHDNCGCLPVCIEDALDAAH
jgi:hypothetical protein